MGKSLEQELVEGALLYERLEMEAKAKALKLENKTPEDARALARKLISNNFKK